MADEEKKDDAAQEEAPAEEEQKEEAPAEEAKEEAPAEEAKEESSDDSPAGEEEVEVPEKFQDLVKQIEEMPVLELNELVKVLEKKFGVSAAAVAVAPGAGGGDAGGDEEKSDFTVELTAAGDQKIQVIKAVKEALGLGLKEAKDLVDGAPAVLKEKMPKEEAEELKGKIEEAGGSVELK